ncbi:unnamed protein product [Aphanomyces euteiches]
MEAIEAISGMIAGALLMQLFPLCFSLALQKLATSRQRMHGSTAGTSHPTKNFPRCICSPTTQFHSEKPPDRSAQPPFVQ